MASDEEVGRLAFHRAMCQKRSCDICAGPGDWAYSVFGLDAGGSHNPFANLEALVARFESMKPWYDRPDWFEHLTKELSCG